MTDTTIDPLYGHKIGSFACSVEKCSGHKKAYFATAHRVVTEFYKGTQAEARKLYGDSVDTLGVTKARKKVAKDLKITNYNGMSVAELTEAIESAKTGNTKRVKELQKLAKGRTEEKLQALKNKNK